MSILVDWQLREFATALGINPRNIQPASVDLVLGNEIKIKRLPFDPRTIPNAMQSEVFKLVLSEANERVPLPHTAEAYRLWRKYSWRLYEYMHIEEETVTRKDGETFLFVPGETYICHTKEVLHVAGDMVGLLYLRSSFGRMGVSHKMAGFFDPGFVGTAVLELDFDFPVRAVIGETRICQMSFERTDSRPVEVYGGRYQGQRGAQDTIGGGK